MSEVSELVNFLAKSVPTGPKNQALAYITGLPSSEDGRSLLLKNPDVVKAVALLVLQDENAGTVSQAYKCLTNLTSVPAISEYLVEHDYGGITAHLVNSSLQERRLGSAAMCCHAVEPHQRQAGCRKALDAVALDQQVRRPPGSVLFQHQRKPRPPQLRLLEPLSTGRGSEVVIGPGCQEGAEILSFFLTLETSSVRRHGAAAVLRNCCFETDSNEWLLSPEVDILPRLLYPLMGPEELDDDEMEKLPLELQYLGSDKQREGSPEIRQMLIEAIMQLCATKKCREHIKNSGAYYVLRELHKSESCRPVVVACENLVDILISDEPEPGMENLKDVDIPEHLTKKFEAYNKELLKE
ncbi:hypothetical protein MRX96_050922 [Rhipicephalus microplus]